MNKYYYLICISSLISFAIGCSSGSTVGDGRALIGKYNFTMYDSTDEKLADGILEIEKNINNILSGKYEFTKKYSEDFPGYSSMKRNFEGNFNTKENKIFLNMNPKIADDNVFINAKFQNDSLIGKWTYTTMMGEKGKGGFKAGKVK